ncbi:hypothetical protein pb186bvf_020073 [Paramecium bursaria]
MLYQPSKSALDQTLLQINQSQNQKSQFLEQSLKKQMRLLTDVRFQQNHVKSQITSLDEKHQHTFRKHIKKQEELQIQINESQQFVTINSLKHALTTNVWNQHIGYFLNPLAAFHSISVSDGQMQQQILLKHSEQKLIALQRTINTDLQITQFSEQIKMFYEDIDGKNEQINTLMIEYDELEEVLDQWRGQNVNFEPIQKMFHLKNQLNEMKLQYMQLGQQRQESEQQLQEITKLVEQVQKNLNDLRQDKIDIKNLDQYNEAINPNILVWLSPDKIYQILIQNNPQRDQICYNYTYSIQIHDKIYNCCISLLDKQLPFEQRQKKFDINFQELEQLFIQNNNFTLVDGCEFECLLHSKNQQELLNVIQQKAFQFKSVLKQQVNIYIYTLENTNLKSKQIEIERRVHKLLYDQSMIQCNYQRLESQIQQLRTTGPILIMNTQTYQLENLLDRMNQIEQLKRRNKQLIEIQLPQQVASLKQQIINQQNILKKQVQELVNQTQLEQQQFYNLQNQYAKDSAFKLPKLIIDDNNDAEYLQMEMQQNREEQKSLEELYKQQITLLQNKLEDLKQQENQFIQQIDKIKISLNDYKKQQDNSIYDVTSDSFLLNETKITQKKENIPPQQRKSSQADQSVLGIIQIDMQQERKTSQGYLFTKRPSTIRTSNTQLKSRSKSQSQLLQDQVHNRSTSSMANQHFLQFQSPSIRKTKLTLIPQTQLSSQMSSKNPLLSPNSVLLGSSSQKYLDMEQSICINSSTRKMNDETSRNSGGRRTYMTRSPCLFDQGKVFKVYKRLIANKVIKKVSNTSPPPSLNNYIPKYIQYNHKSKTIDLFNTTRPIHDLGPKEQSWVIKQLKDISQIYDVKGVFKQSNYSTNIIDFSFSGCSISISKYQKMELLFGKKEDAIEFINFIKSL